MLDFLINPDTKSNFLNKTDRSVIFEDGSEFIIFEETPILFGKNSIFNDNDITSNRTTTQSAQHLDTKNFKNFIRRKILPSLCKDFSIEKRYADLSLLLTPGSKVLIIGTGDKKEYYKNVFQHCTVITSDVHNQFKPDYVFDGHYIPFKDNTFNLVLAAQVIEHTINPWLFSSELQRVTKLDGFLQIEAPQTFPYHAEPYDFFRFTYTGMRSLFPECNVVNASITEGNASMVAVTISNYIVNLSSQRSIRSFYLLITRLLLGWIKYLDKFQPNLNRRTVTMPKGYAFTLKKDTIKRSQKDLLREFYTLNK